MRLLREADVVCDVIYERDYDRSVDCDKAGREGGEEEIAGR